MQMTWNLRCAAVAEIPHLFRRSLRGERRRKSAAAAAALKKGGFFIEGAAKSATVVMSFEMTDTPKAGLALAAAALHKDFLLQRRKDLASSSFPLGPAFHFIF